MRPVSLSFLLACPAVLAILLLAFFSAPMAALPISLAPNVAWVMTLAVLLLYPPSWPLGFAFLLGLAQDVLYGTPLGAQGLLTLLLLMLVRSQARRQHYQLFRVRWLEAAGTLVLWHGLLWAMLQFVSPHAPSLPSLLIAGLVSAAWYPVFYGMVYRLTTWLPLIK